MNHLAKTITLTFAAACALIVTSTAAWSDTTAKGGAADLIGNKAVQPVAVTARTSDHCAMVKSCPDCRTVTKTATVTEGKNIRPQTVTTSDHVCAKCKTGVQTTGHGKVQSTVSTHICENQGQKTSACCVK